MRADELDMVMSHLDDGVAIIEEGGRVLHANQALLTAFGSRAAEPLERVAGAGRGEGPGLPRRTGARSRTTRTRSTVPWPARSSRPRRSTTSTSTASSGCSSVSAFQVPHAEGGPQARDDRAARHHRGQQLPRVAGLLRRHRRPRPEQPAQRDRRMGRGARGGPRARATSRTQLAAAPMVQHIRVGVEQMRALHLRPARPRRRARPVPAVRIRRAAPTWSSTSPRPATGRTTVARSSPGDLRRRLGRPGPAAPGPRQPDRQRVQVRRPGHRAARAHRGRARSTTAWARVQVRDNGIGIPRDQRERVFDASTASPARTTRAPASGWRSASASSSATAARSR